MPVGPVNALQLDPVVVEAMKQLTAWTSRRHHRQLGDWRQRHKGLKDPSSRSGAIHVFKNLNYHGYPYDPAEIQAWATAHGWKASDAQELCTYAKGVLAGTRYHTVPDPFGQTAIDRWIQMAAKV
jgi:hypothetical protein